MMAMSKIFANITAYYPSNEGGYWCNKKYLDFVYYK